MVDKAPDNAPVETHNFWYYSRPANFARIIGNRKLIFGLWGLFGYVA